MMSLRSQTFAVLVSASLVQCGIIEEFTQPSSLAIERFGAAPPDVLHGSPATLSWEVRGADSVEIDQGIGTVTASGSRQVRPDWTTTYTLTAHAESSSATATVQIRVRPPTASPSPVASPSASPSPSPSPTPSPSPSPSASPSPTPTPTPTPTPSPSPTPVSCGAPAGPARNCAVTVVRPTALAAGECVQLNEVELAQSCPVGFNTTRSLRFSLTAHTARTGLRWRRSVTSSDLLEPSSGAVSSNGATSALVTDVVLDSAVTIEIVHGDQVLLAFTLRHY